MNDQPKDPKTTMALVPAWAIRDAVLAMYSLGALYRHPGISSLETAVEAMARMDQAAQLYSTAAKLEAILDQALEVA